MQKKKTPNKNKNKNENKQSKRVYGLVGEYNLLTFEQALVYDNISLMCNDM